MQFPLRTISDNLSKTHAEKLFVTLCSYFSPTPKLSETVPPGHHFVFFNNPYPEPQLDTDGYENTYTKFRNDSKFALRWLSGSIEYLSPLKLDTKAVCHEQSTLLTGSKYRYTLNTERTIQQPHNCIIESREFLYLDLKSKIYERMISKLPKRTSLMPTPNFHLKITPTLVFRYNALCFNAHKIHYDLEYAQTVERMPQLITPAPLIVTLAHDFLRHHLNREISQIKYHIRSPLYINDVIQFAADDGDKENKLLILRNSDIIMDSSIIYK